MNSDSKMVDTVSKLKRAKHIWSQLLSGGLAMPGPGPHLMYAMGSGLALTTLTNGRFSPHHTLIYTINAFFGPDIGSFTEWLASLFGGFGYDFGSELADAIHHPFYYVIILGLPLCCLYSWLSRIFLLKKVLDSFPAVSHWVHFKLRRAMNCVIVCMKIDDDVTNRPG